MERLEVSAGMLLHGEGAALDLAELGRLLAALDGSPRVGAAASSLGVSYRGAWGKLVRAERLLGVALVERVKGHGSRLTPAGASLAAATRRFEQAAVRRLAAPSDELRTALASMHALAERPLRLAASHDLLLQALFATDEALRMSVRFVGSGQALEALRRGEADLAGFHLPEPLAPLRGRPDVFADASLFVEPAMRREQGLIVARGNPMRIRDVTDLARLGLRFVNRQQGAGTRTWFDRLLRERGMQPRQIRGYEQEEFTHLAVAATVAAGAADAGFGLRAAAARLGVGFVPVGTELYFLCGARALRHNVTVQAVRKRLRATARSTPGYGPVGATRSAATVSRYAPRRP